MIPTRRPASGFTLIELMVTVLIVSILASIAIPAYIAQVRKSRRTEAKTALLDLAGREERYFNTSNAYTDVAANLGYSAPGATVTALPVGSGYYTVTVTFTAAVPPAPGAYSITAIPVGDQAKDTECTTFTVDSTGLQSASNTDCWH